MMARNNRGKKHPFQTIFTKKHFLLRNFKCYT